ncbi:MAG: hypothetical protein EHM93_15310 [Bacteroidales bacterium]|nr:MAG: hypothetical protein EHM93_15310 [Bacteroidales bacterium]
MSTMQIHDIREITLDSAVRQKIIDQANFSGLEQNLATGDIVTIKVGDQICQLKFNKEEALTRHRAPACNSKDDDSVKDISFASREELSNLLNLDEPVSEEVYLAALHDNNYLHNLLVSKGTPEFFTHFLQQAKGVLANLKVEDEHYNGKNTDELIIDFAKALLKWGKSGFAKVDNQTFNQRLNACLACDFLSSVPDKFVYKMLSKKGSSGICRFCGCLVEKKALLATDTCPEVSLENNKINRWGEPHA